MPALAEVPAKDVVAHAYKDWLRNLVFTVLLGAAVLLIAGFSTLLAKAGFWLLVVLVALDALHVLITQLLPGLVMPFFALKGDVSWGEVGWLSLGSSLRLIEVAIGVAIVLYLQTRLWPGLDILTQVLVGVRP